jgi:hypothetical protein
MVVREPVRKDLVLMRVAAAEHREQARIEVRQRIEILRIYVLDPLPVLLRMPTVSDADEQRRGFPWPKKDIARANEPRRPSARAWDRLEAIYFGADAADAADCAASAAALAAAAESAAAEAAASGAGVAAGGVVSVVGAGASLLLPQALSTSAATKALKASLVFIYRYPRNLMITF